MQFPCFNVFKEIFFISNKKVVPNNIYDLLILKGLAFWIMVYANHYGEGLHISLQAFSNEDVDKLIFTIQNKFNLKCSIHYNKDKKSRIYVFKESVNILILRISQYFVK